MILLNILMLVIYGAIIIMVECGLLVAWKNTMIVARHWIGKGGISTVLGYALGTAWSSFTLLLALLPVFPLFHALNALTLQ